MDIGGNETPVGNEVPAMSNEERYRFQAAFWLNMVSAAAWRNKFNEFEDGDERSVLLAILKFGMMTGIGGGAFMDDVLDTEGMDEEEIAWRTENRKGCIPWSIAKECCAMFDLNIDPIADAYWEDITNSVAQNRAFLAGSNATQNANGDESP